MIGNIFGYALIALVAFGWVCEWREEMAAERSKETPTQRRLRMAHAKHKRRWPPLAKHPGDAWAGRPRKTRR
jgi:hypothetical protein